MTKKKMEKEEKFAYLCMLISSLPITGTFLVVVLIYTGTWVWFLIFVPIVIISIILIKYYIPKSNWYVRRRLGAERRREEIKKETERINQKIQAKIETYFKKVLNRKLFVSIKREGNKDYVVMRSRGRNTPEFYQDLKDSNTPSLILSEMGSDFFHVFKTIKRQYPQVNDAELSNHSYNISKKYIEDLQKKVEEQQKELAEKIAGSSRHIPSDIRRTVWSRDKGRCVLCGNQENLEYDHIIPFSKGGAHSVSNIRILCRACNRRRNDNIGDK